MGERWRLVRDPRAITTDWQVLSLDYRPEGSEQTIEVVPADLLDQALDAIRGHWRAKYAGHSAEMPISPEDRTLYEVSTDLRAQVAGETE